MALTYFIRVNLIDADKIENLDFVTHNRKRMGEKLYGMATRVMTEYIENRNENNSGGYFFFGMILGESGQASKKDVDYLWRRMKEVFGDTEESNNLINRMLGTICMICVARDPRPWVYRDDMERQEKLDNNEIPDANEYWIGNYEIPEPVQEKPTETLEDQLKKLKEKFNSK